MSDAFHAAGWILLAGGATVAALGAAAWRRENALLRRMLRAVAPSGRITRSAELVALKRALAAAIRYDEARMHDRRPLLRASARRTLETGVGFCGENARVAVRLLRLGGVDAHRLYLEGARWGHVVVEHRWESGWRLFDGHADPRTALADDQVGRVDADDLSAFPNREPANPWRRAWRIPGLGRLRARWAERIRPPAPLTALAETPALVAVAGGLALVAAGAWLLTRP